MLDISPLKSRPFTVYYIIDTDAEQKCQKEAFST